MKPRNCKTCGKPYSQSELIEKENLRRLRLKLAHERARQSGYRPKTGRPKVRDDLKIKELRRHGYSLRQIAKILNLSPATIWTGSK